MLFVRGKFLGLLKEQFSSKKTGESFERLVVGISVSQPDKFGGVQTVTEEFGLPYSVKDSAEKMKEIEALTGKFGNFGLEIKERKSGDKVFIDRNLTGVYEPVKQ